MKKSPPINHTSLLPNLLFRVVGGIIKESLHPDIEAGDIKNLTGSLTSRDPRMESLPESNLSNMIQIGLLELPSFAMPMAKGIIFWLQLA
ncbi:hypothetical protein BOX24_10550 [Leptospirillum ferriphilum]|uniref:Uncharacterized protein n=1 Tax=Leptospirillum ferriphilum TaxID=178606 RepID=A0A1V3SSP8_9BACT|nr:hypothetical protein BOX24_10550 [Leptospirillum ferriphilum]